MKKPLIAGTTLLLAGIVAFALTRDSREEKTADAPKADTPAVEVAEVELADPGTIEEPAPEPVPDALPQGWEIDEVGHVWEPLSFEKPQVRNNGDGTLTMRKLIRIYENGKVREIPITATAVASQKRLPVQTRKPPKVTSESTSTDQTEPSTDGQ